MGGFKIKLPKLPNKLPDLNPFNDHKELEEAKRRAAEAAKQVAEATAKAAEATAKAATAPIAATIDVVSGKPVDDSLREALAAQIAPAEGIANLAVATSALQSTLEQQIVSSVAGPLAEDVVADLKRLATIYDQTTAAAIIHATQQFLLTGDLSQLQPAAVLMAGEVIRCRELLYPLGTSVPAEVVASLPEEFRSVCDGVRVLARANVPGTLNAPSIAIKHLGNAGAMTLVDVIVFDTIPGFESEDELFLWVHELQHVIQYEEKGVSTFCKEYIGEALGFKAKGDTLNFLEAEADYTACRFYPDANPFYIDSCPT